jgi:hypothetical protein
MADRDEARREYEDLKSEFKGANFEDFKKGEWFASFVKWMLESYSKQVDAEYIKKKYPGAGPVNQSKKAIAIASKYAAVAGGLSAAAVTAAELSIGGTAGLDLPVAIPVIGASIMGDVAFTTRLQLRCVYDLSVIHRAPLSMSDVEDCYFIFLSALGIKMEEMGGNVVKAVGPKVVQYNVRKLLRSGLRGALQALIKKIAGSAIAKKLTEKVLLRVLVPGLSIPISSSLNYAFTRQMLGVANTQMRRRGAVIEPLMRLFHHAPEFPREHVVKSLVVTMEAPGREGWDQAQMDALRHAQSFLSLTDDAVAALESWFERKPADLVASLPPLKSEAAVALVDFLLPAVALGDTKHDDAHAEVVAAVATHYQVPFGRERIAEVRKAL